MTINSITVMKNLFFLLLICYPTFVLGQKYNPVNWKVSNPTEYKVGDTIRIELQGKIEKGWYFYSSDSESTELIVPAKLTIRSNETFDAVGNLIPVNSIDYYDNKLNQKVKIMKNIATFYQLIIAKTKPISLQLSINYTVLKIGINKGTAIHKVDDLSKSIN